MYTACMIIGMVVGLFTYIGIASIEGMPQNLAFFIAAVVGVIAMCLFNAIGRKGDWS